MTIMSQDAFGFTVGGTFRGTELPQVTFKYTLFCLEDVGDGVTALGLWAVRNGVSQAMTDSVALGKDVKVSEALDSWNEKAKSLLAGNVPTSGARGPRISDFESECRTVIIIRLKNAGTTDTDAKKIAKNWKAYLSDLATQKAEKTGESQESIFNAAVLKIETAAQQRIDAAKTPDADDLV